MRLPFAVQTCGGQVEWGQTQEQGGTAVAPGRPAPALQDRWQGVLLLLWWPLSASAWCDLCRDEGLLVAPEDVAGLANSPKCSLSGI